MTNTAVQLQQACVSFGDVCAVDHVDLEITAGKVHVLLGRSGSGKTTLLRAIAGFEPLTSGRVLVRGNVVDDGTRAGWAAPEKRNIGFVFQDYALFTHLDAASNVGFGIKGSRSEKHAQALKWLGRVELDAQVSRKPGELSGGEQQRVALARALAQGPDVVLLDEPFSNLDPHLRRQVRNDTLDLLRESGATAIFVTHDIAEAFALGDSLTVLDQGRLEQTGPPEDLYHRPLTEAVARLAGPVGLVPIESWDAGIATTRFGKIASNEGTTLVVRPEQWELGDGGEGKIVRRRFTGSGYEYDVACGDAEYVVRSEVAQHVGATVSLTLPRGPAQTALHALKS